MKEKIYARRDLVSRAKFLSSRIRRSYDKRTGAQLRLARWWKWRRWTEQEDCGGRDRNWFVMNLRWWRKTANDLRKTLITSYPRTSNLPANNQKGEATRTETVFWMSFCFAAPKLFGHCSMECFWSGHLFGGSGFINWFFLSLTMISVLQKIQKYTDWNARRTDIWQNLRQISPKLWAEDK